MSREARVAGVLLAAGRARRMKGENKLLRRIGKRSMIAAIARRLLESGLDPLIVVVGHEAELVKEALEDEPVIVVVNPVHGEGVSTSVKVGIAALPSDVDAVLIALGDMPKVTSAHVTRLVAAFAPDQGRAIGVPTYRGRRGNPVLWAKAFFGEMERLTGDRGARGLIEKHRDQVYEIAMGDAGVLLDIDTPDDLAGLSP
ncbi:MAG: nucleotidyltransferase family protein [Alphaproteobacteria bacterium]